MIAAGRPDFPLLPIGPPFSVKRNETDPEVAYVLPAGETFNASANRTELRELSRTYVSNFCLQLGNDGYWNRSYTFNVSSPGIYRLYFDLHKLPDVNQVYRYLFLTVRVRS